MRHFQQSQLRAFSSRAFMHSRPPVKYPQLANYRFTQTVAASNITRQNSPTPPRDLLQASTGSLIRAYFVYSTLSFPYFVDAAPTILKFATSIPIVKQLALFVIRNTFFKHFVGGDTIEDTVPLVNSLRERNLGSIVAYSVEVDEEEAKQVSEYDKKRQSQGIPEHEKKLQEFMSSIVFAGELEDSRSPAHAEDRRLYVAVKLSALVPSADTLVNFSQALIDNQVNPHDPFELDLLYKESLPTSMTQEDVAELRILHSNVKKIGELAVKHQVRILMDAEHTWYQPAIDAFSTDLMRTCNAISNASHVNPVVYLTYQAYLRSTPERLGGIVKHAAANKYVLGVKLVRGAYIVQEEEYHYAKPSNRGTLPPVWSEKHETDACYNRCATMLLDYVTKQPPSSNTEGNNAAHVGVLFGTHNRESCDIIMDELVRRELASAEDMPADGDAERTLQLNRWVSSQVQFAQLYGMADDLTNYVSCRLGCSGTPTVNKFIPYGKLEDVMPYLSRRAIENKSVLGNSNTFVERTRVYNELKRRLFN